MVFIANLAHPHYEQPNLLWIYFVYSRARSVLCVYALYYIYICHIAMAIAKSFLFYLLNICRMSRKTNIFKNVSARAFAATDGCLSMYMCKWMRVKHFIFQVCICICICICLCLVFYFIYCSAKWRRARVCVCLSTILWRLLKCVVITKPSAESAAAGAVCAFLYICTKFYVYI